MPRFDAISAHARRYGGHYAIGLAWLAVLVGAPHLRPGHAGATRPAGPAAVARPISTAVTPVDVATAPTVDTSVPLSAFVAEPAPDDFAPVEASRDDTVAPPAPAPAPASPGSADTSADPPAQGTQPGPSLPVPPIKLPPLP